MVNLFRILHAEWLSPLVHDYSCLFMFIIYSITFMVQFCIHEYSRYKTGMIHEYSRIYTMNILEFMNYSCS